MSAVRGAEGATAGEGGRGFAVGAVQALAAGAAGAVLAFWGLGLLGDSWMWETTDDAFLDGPVIAISPKIAGRVRTVPVRQNQEVAEGDLLATLDSADFEAQADRHRASLAAAQANKKLVESGFQLFRARVETARAAAGQAAADADAAKAAADRLRADLARAEGLAAGKVATPQEFDAARAASDGAASALKAAREKLRAEQSKVEEAQIQLTSAESLWAQTTAMEQGAAAELRMAELNLSYARITAPRSGRVTRKAVEPGAYAQAGQQLMTLVPSELWVTANFKETQLARLREGQAARVEIDAAPGRVFQARVDTVQAGSGARFSLLPPENAVGNYVKVVQRVPVKLVFTEPLNAGQILGPGMSVQPAVRVGSDGVPTRVRTAAAILTAAALGIPAWRRARRARRAAPAPAPAPAP